MHTLASSRPLYPESVKKCKSTNKPTCKSLLEDRVKQALRLTDNNCQSTGRFYRGLYGAGHTKRAPIALNAGMGMKHVDRWLAPSVTTAWHRGRASSTAAGARRVRAT